MVLKRQYYQLENLIKRTISNKYGYTQSVYRTLWIKFYIDERGHRHKIFFDEWGQSNNLKVHCEFEKDILMVFHEPTRFFEYDITNQKIISFNKVNQSTKLSLNIIGKVLKLPGEFRTIYKNIGYDIVYTEKGKFYDTGMNEIYNLDQRLNKYKSEQNKQKYKRIKTILDVGYVELEEICGNNVWIEKSKGKWYITSDIESGMRFPILAKEAFSVTSTKIDTGGIISYKGNSDIYKVKYYNYITDKIEKGLLNKWEINMNNYSKYKFRIVKDKDGDEWLLESEGEITFDKRIMNDEQVKDFIRYILSIEYKQKYLKHLSYWNWRDAPDIIRNTPINFIITDDSINRFSLTLMTLKTLDIINMIGREIRIAWKSFQGKDGKNHQEYLAVSIYGKECCVYEHDVDSLLRRGFFYYILQRFEGQVSGERTSERIKIISTILPELIKKKKYPVFLNENDKILEIYNSDGEFQISLTDGSLLKRIGNDFIYICVGLNIDIVSKIRPFIIYNGAKFNIDFVTNEIISKMIMLIDEKYPDDKTEQQIRYKR